MPQLSAIRGGEGVEEQGSFEVMAVLSFVSSASESERYKLSVMTVMLSKARHDENRFDLREKACVDRDGAGIAKRPVWLQSRAEERGAETYGSVAAFRDERCRAALFLLSQIWLTYLFHVHTCA